MNPEKVLQYIGGLSAMKFFPSDVEARVAIAEQFALFARSESEVQWVIRRVLALYREWPGVYELRAVYCSKWKPKDGIEAFSAVHVDGIPSEDETTNLQLTGAAPARQLTGDVINSDFPRSALGLIAEVTDRHKAKEATAKAVTEAEIAKVRAAQEANRDPHAAVKLAEELGL